MYAHLIVLNNHYMTDNIYTYKVDKKMRENIQPGMRVIIPFGRGNRLVIGYIIEISYEEPNFSTKKIKKILDIEPVISNELIELAFYIKEKFHSNLYQAFKVIGPPEDAKKIKVHYKFNGKIYDENKINELFSKKQIKEKIESKDIEIKYSIRGGGRLKKEILIYLVNREAKFRKNAHRQLAVFNELKKKSPMKRSELLKKTGASTFVVKSLADREIIKTEEIQVQRYDVDKEKIEETEAIKLNSFQQKAFNEIVSQPGEKFLLHGVTGSGKTEIYLQLAEKTLNENKEVIILVPEISLTPQTIERFTSRFPGNVAVLHSKLTMAERFEQWKRIKNGEVKIVVGARSAIFAPFDNLGLIVIDEEQETSYKSEVNPRYNANDIGKWRAEYNNAYLILGTATPSINTFYRKDEDLILTSINERVKNKNLPPVEIIDMRDELAFGNTSIFSRKLRERLKENLNKKEQSILFLNKRGHSSFIFCRKCGFVKKCEDCDVSMTYHKRQDFLICHYCGKTARIPNLCPECSSNAIGYFGAGTEQVEFYTKSIFPDANIMRMDADTTKSKKAYDDFYESMRKKEVDILIGTQMIAKGLDFKGVSLVGIIMADISLNIPDYQSNERTFQLITQVAGRAGRGEIKGNVILQSYHPNHFAIETAAKHDYLTFYDKEIEIRKHFNYPPFVKIIKILAIANDQNSALKALREISGALQRFKKKKNIKFFNVFGPTPAPIPRIRRRYRCQLLIKFEGHEKEMHLTIDWLQKLFYEKYANKNVNLQFFIE